MLGRALLGFVVVTMVVGCGSTRHDGGSSMGASDSGGDGGTGTTNTSGDASSSGGSGGRLMDSGAEGGISTTSNAGSGGSGGTTDSTTGQGGAASSTEGSGGSAGGAGGSSGGAGGTVTTGGGSGGGPPACPDTPPSPDTACSSTGQLCGYEDCDGAGRTVAQCFSGGWVVDTGPCDGPVVCSGGSGAAECAQGQVCVVLAGGALLETCIENTCGDLAVSCECTGYCSGECVVLGDATSGITIYCNTCPDNTCA